MDAHSYQQLPLPTRQFDASDGEPEDDGEGGIDIGDGGGSSGDITLMPQSFVADNSLTQFHQQQQGAHNYNGPTGK